MRAWHFLVIGVAAAAVAWVVLGRTRTVYTPPWPGAPRAGLDGRRITPTMVTATLGHTGDEV